MGPVMWVGRYSKDLTVIGTKSHGALPKAKQRSQGPALVWVSDG